MKNPRIIFLLVFMAILVAASAYFFFMPKAQYQCGGNDNVYLDFKLFRNGNFSIKGEHYNFIEGKHHGYFAYSGHYSEDQNTYDLSFKGLTRQQIEDLFARTTAGVFIRNTNTYRINKKTIDGRNLVYIEGCLIEPKTTWLQTKF